MSNSDPNRGERPPYEAGSGPSRGRRRVDAEDYPFTVSHLRQHLERLGFDADEAYHAGEDVRDMQRRVTELRTSLERDAGRNPRSRQRNERPGAETDSARARQFEKRIQAALADAAAGMRDDRERPDKRYAGPAGLDVASRAWLDQRFAAMRARLEDALTRTPSKPPREEEVCAALDEARKRLSSLENRLADADERQRDVSDKIIRLIDARDGEARTDTRTPSQPVLESLDARVQSLQQGFERAMSELDAMKSGTHRLAVRASATVARQTARATAQYVSKAVREAAPQQRFDRLEEGLNGCMTEARSLRQETGIIHQTLEEGLEDLRGRINELTLITRKVLAAPAVDGPAGAASSHSSAHAEAAAGFGSPASGQRPARRIARSAPRRQGGRVEGRDRPEPRVGDSLVTRLGFAVVVALLVAASFAMLYAQLSSAEMAPPSAKGAVEPTSSSARDNRPGRRAIHVEPAAETIILPGIILANTARDPV